MAVVFSEREAQTRVSGNACGAGMAAKERTAVGAEGLDVAAGCTFKGSRSESIAAATMKVLSLAAGTGRGARTAARDQRERYTRPAPQAPFPSC